MNMKINEKPPTDQKRCSRLTKEAQQILTEITKISSSISDISTSNQLIDIQKSIATMYESWGDLSASLEGNLRGLVDKSNKISIFSKNYRARSEKKLLKLREEVEKKQKNLSLTKKYAGRSLNRFNSQWGQDLNAMKKSLKYQRNKKDEINENISHLEKRSIDVLHDALTSAIPRKSRISIEKDLISHESAFSHLSDQPEIINFIDNCSVNSEPPSNYSIEFDKCMDEIQRRNPPAENLSNISIDKSMGGWKSEYESEADSFVAQVNPSEIKRAISILRKANLLNSKCNFLGKIGTLLKSSENSHQIGLLLQLLDLQSKPKSSQPQHSQKLKKPPLQIPRLKRPREADPDLTPKANFFVSDEIEFNKTILSSENPLSARQRDENLNHLFEDPTASPKGMQDVQLEDLLNIPYFVHDLKFGSGELLEQDQSEDNESRVLFSEPKEYYQCLSILNPSEAKLPRPIRKQNNAYDGQSTGISSHSGLRSRIILKTAGSEASQKVLTNGSRATDDSFKYL